MISHSEDPPNKLPPMRVDQHAIELVSGASLPDLSHYRIDPIKHIKLERQVDGFLLKVKQSCVAPIKYSFLKDKFWIYIVTKDVCWIKDVTIYGRSMFKNSKNVVTRKSNTLQFINFLSITVKQRDVFH